MPTLAHQRSPASATGGGGPCSSGAWHTAHVLVHAPSCRPVCAHASPCAACHDPGTYIPPAAIELWPCQDSVTHIRWNHLSLVGSTEPGPTKGLLMSNGLCLAAPQSNTTAPLESDPESALAPLRQRVQMKTLDTAEIASDAAALVSAIRITVTSTNGIANAVINEVRLYDHDGVQPFPTKGSAKSYT